MKKNFLSLVSFIIVGLLASALPVSAQSRAQARDRDYVNELNRGNLARVGGGNYGWGRVGSIRSYGWGRVGQEIALGMLEAVIARQQMNAVMAMTQPPPSPVFDYYQPPPALVYQQQQMVARAASRTSAQEMSVPSVPQNPAASGYMYFCGFRAELDEQLRRDNLRVLDLKARALNLWNAFPGDYMVRVHARDGSLNTCEVDPGEEMVFIVPFGVGVYPDVRIDGVKTGQTTRTVWLTDDQIQMKRLPSNDGYIIAPKCGGQDCQ